MINRVLISSLAFVFLLSTVSAACTIDTVLVNQDPYPSMPGEYVKVVFQVSGVSSPECSNLKFWIDDQYPFSLDKDATREITMKSGTFVRNYADYFLVPYKLRVDEAALDGDSNLTVKYSLVDGGNVFEKQFNINVEDSRSDFEVYVKDYDSATKQLTLDILNTGPNNVDALTVSLPKQPNIDFFGTNNVIMGALDANEEDLAIFDAEAREGEISLDISYTDQINERRKLQKTVYFDPTLFNKEIQTSNGLSAFWAFVIGILIPLVWIFVRKKFWKKKDRK